MSDLKSHEQDIFSDIQTRMQQTVQALKKEFAKSTALRASPQIIEDLLVNYQNSQFPINHLAQVVAEDAHTLSIRPWDSTSLTAIEKAIIKADLKLNISTNNGAVYARLPIMTEDRRQELAKILKKEAENARVSIRNLRNEIKIKIKNLAKNQHIAMADTSKMELEDKLQKLTNETMMAIEETLSNKIKDILNFK